MSKEAFFDIPVIGKIYRNYIIKKEGGGQNSTTLRKYMKDKHNVEVGMYSYGGCFSPEFNLGGTVHIGRYCSVAASVNYFGANHPMSYATMSPYFYDKSWTEGLGEDGCFSVCDVERCTLNIGNDVWIGHGVIITSGCKKIGNGAVIGAGSVVTRDVPAYSVVAGVPAKKVKERFYETTSELLEASRWWELTPEELYKFYPDIDKPDVWAKRVILYRREK